MKNDIFKKTIAQEIARLEQLVALESTRTPVQTSYRYPNAVARRIQRKAQEKAHIKSHLKNIVRPSGFSFFARIAHAFSFFL